MRSDVKFLPALRLFATLAAIFGIFVLVLIVVSTLSMAAPLLSGTWPRDLVVIAFICLPLLQVGMIVVANSKEETRPVAAMRLYGAVLMIVCGLVAIPALR